MGQKSSEEKSFGNNELRINSLWLMMGSVGLSYERILNNNTSFGLVIEKPFDKYTFQREFTVAPYYRVYLSKRKASGFFMETNLTVYRERYESDDYYSYWPEVSSHEYGAGLGIALGGKFITEKGFVLDIYAGIGKALNNPSHIEKIFGTGGVSIGKRF